MPRYLSVVPKPCNKLGAHVPVSTRQIGEKLASCFKMAPKAANKQAKAEKAKASAAKNKVDTIATRAVFAAKVKWPG